ncbi:Homologous-pairing protein 2 [Tetrabaena socialis]|uniref:Homologous-pairing protein 2 homolog n=1 Tax=Tetrabaena socialis TaxID=47790 RepID=A0A2J8A6X4_9CHLO|nr:Homologous-pairing protein 2 [Tetrabaena socialis]|eukprot:PNH08274.1 Homologous-pairing protein 2 [Tetrabaena socialis]
MATHSAEATIERIAREHNKPFSLQQLADLGQTTGLKKAQVTKAVDALVASGRLTAKLEEDSAKLKLLKSGTVLVTAEERAAVEKLLQTNLEWWRKRRSMFKGIWSTISENLDGKQSALFEEAGIETDETAGADLAEAERLIPKKQRRL